MLSCVILTVTVSVQELKNLGFEIFSLAIFLATALVIVLYPLVLLLDSHRSSNKKDGAMAL